MAQKTGICPTVQGGQKKKIKERVDFKERHILGPIRCSKTTFFL
jgi:hypothetical protein